jgi:preprotein translocase subunit SecD
MQNRYPLWKNLLLILIFIAGLIYAVPNLFGEDPAVQISSSILTLSDRNLEDAKEALQKAGIPFTKVSREKDSFLIRFADTDNELKARDLLQASLGKDFIVAINLASRTPNWLLAIGANPMKLGLDLRGGVNFLLEVDTKELIKAREDGDSHSLGGELREANIRYLGIEKVEPHGLMLHFRDLENLNKANAVLGKFLPDYTIEKIVSGNDYKIKATMSEAALFKVYDYAIDQTMNTLRNRVNELGVSEAIVQRQGQNHISVDLPGVQDTARAKEIIGSPATLRFQLVDIEHDPESAMMGEVPIGTKLYEYEGRHYLLKDQIVLQGSSITYATASYSQDGRPSVNVHLGGGGESSFNRVTSENIGKPLAVVYVESKTQITEVNGKKVISTHPEERLINVATIQSALGNNFEITGLQNEKYAQNLALLLRSGALVAPVSIVQELTVGPSMGKTNIHKGLVSVIVGMLLVICFMAFYYRLFGLIADLALLLNLIFIVAILSILKATLTLPGIAGMVLTVGMAVDANVLIYERIREELRNGLGVQASICAGYERAFTTIVDANVSTLIVAMVLFALGSGAVQGFAITLTIGLMTSMLTAIVFTRAIVNLIYGKRNVKKLPIGI